MSFVVSISTLPLLLIVWDMFLNEATYQALHRSQVLNRVLSLNGVGLFAEQE